MNFRSLVIACSAVLSLLLFAHAGVAAPKGSATQTVRRVNSAIAKTLSGKDKANKDESKLLEQARAQLGDFLNIEELGQRAMKDHWDSLSAKERTEFLRLLRSLIETNYLKGLRSNLSYEVRYLGEAREGELVRVKTLVVSQRKGRPLKIEIDYLLSAVGKSWRTIDISTDGIGLIENYRAMFNSIIAKSGTEGLLKRMRAKLATLSG